MQTETHLIYFSNAYHVSQPRELNAIFLNVIKLKPVVPTNLYKLCLRVSVTFSAYFQLEILLSQVHPLTPLFCTAFTIGPDFI